MIYTSRAWNNFRSVTYFPNAWNLPISINKSYASTTYENSEKFLELCRPPATKGKPMNTATSFDCSAQSAWLICSGAFPFSCRTCAHLIHLNVNFMSSKYIRKQKKKKLKRVLLRFIKRMWPPFYWNYSFFGLSLLLRGGCMVEQRNEKKNTSKYMHKQCKLRINYTLV